MKSILFSIFGILILISSCKKKEILLTNEGEIAGFGVCDYACIAGCPCPCIGYIFHFTDTGDTSRVVIDNSTIISLPSNVQYPVHITVNWQNTTRCGEKAIKIINYKIL